MADEITMQERIDRLEAENQRLRAALEELAAIPPGHAAKLPWSSYHALLRAIGQLYRQASRAPSDGDPR